MESRYAAILCPGPSLKKTIPKEWRYGRVVAVTDAIFADAPITHWCHTENPKLKQRLAYTERILELQPIIWGRDEFAKRWRVMMHLQDYEHFELEHHYKTTVKRLPYTTEIDPWSHGPTFHALARCIADGFTHIDLYGSDWRGENNYHPVTGGVLGRCSKDPGNRWRGELALFARVQKEAHSHGVEVQRVYSSLEHHLSGSVDDEGAAGGHAGLGDDGGHQSSHLNP